MFQKLVLRSRPDVVAEWDGSEVARRWLMLCPERRDKHAKPEEPSEFQLSHICKDKAKLEVIRSRLSDLSWWMRLLSHNIAQRANKENGEIGKFRQARYRAIRLLDETAILACAAYVDLNPIRAALAETIEESGFTSAQKRFSVFSFRRTRATTTISDLRTGRETSRSGTMWMPPYPACRPPSPPIRGRRDR